MTTDITLQAINLIPSRKEGAATGSAFVANNNNIFGLQREQNIILEFLNGNIPNFIRNFIPVTVSEKENAITYFVMPDVLCIGSDEDYVRIPMAGGTAKKIADVYDCVLPTKKMCDQIWKAAEIKLTPYPKGPPYDNSMLATSTYYWHNSIIEKQLEGKDKTKLITGHKKDVIIDKNWLTRQDRVVIYGWFYPDGKAIQGPIPNYRSHELNYYADYAHGIRLVAQDVIVNGNQMRFFDVLNDPALAGLINEDGAFNAYEIYM